MMLHPSFRQWTRYVDGELDAEAKERLGKHLASCTTCRRRVTLLGHLDDALQQPEPVAAPSESAVARLMQRLGPPPRAHRPLVGEVRAVIGEVMIQAIQQAPGLAAFAGLGLKPGDRVQVAGQGQVCFALADGTLLWLDEATDVLLGEEGSDAALHLASGRLLADVRPRASGFAIETPCGVATVLGTRFELAQQPQGTTRLAVAHGRVRLRNQAGAEIVLEGGRQVEISAFQMFRPRRLAWAGRLGSWTAATSDTGATLASRVAAFARLRTLRLFAAIALLIALVGAVALVTWRQRATPAAAVQAPSYRHQPVTTLEPQAPFAYAGFHWPAGHQVRTRMEIKTHPAAGAQASAVAMHQEQELVFEAVAHHLDGTLELALRFEWIRLELTDNATRLVFDTRAADFATQETPMARLLRAQRAFAFRARVGGQGDVLALTNFEAFRSSLGQDAPEAAGEQSEPADYERLFELLTPRPVMRISAGVGASVSSTEERQHGALETVRAGFNGWDIYLGHRCAVFNLGWSRPGEAPETSGQGRVWVEPELGLVMKQSLTRPGSGAGRQLWWQVAAIEPVAAEPSRGAP